MLNPKKVKLSKIPQNYVIDFNYTLEFLKVLF